MTNNSKYKSLFESYKLTCYDSKRKEFILSEHTLYDDLANYRASYNKAVKIKYKSKTLNKVKYRLKRIVRLANKDLSINNKFNTIELNWIQQCTNLLVTKQLDNEMHLNDNKDVILLHTIGKCTIAQTEIIRLNIHTKLADDCLRIIANHHGLPDLELSWYPSCNSAYYIKYTEQNQDCWNEYNLIGELCHYLGQHRHKIYNYLNKLDRRKDKMFKNAYIGGNTTVTNKNDENTDKNKERIEKLIIAVKKYFDYSKEIINH